MFWTIVKLAGLLLLPLGIVLFARQWQGIAGQEITTAKVVRLEPSHSSKGGPTYYVVAEFRDRAGATHQYRSAIGSNPPTHAVGDTIRISHDRHDAGSNASMQFHTRFGVAWWCMGIGLLCVWI